MKTIGYIKIAYGFISMIIVLYICYKELKQINKDEISQIK
jgi:hypothetical protein